MHRDYKPWLGVVAQVDAHHSVLRYNPNTKPSIAKVTLDLSFADVKGDDGSFRFISDDLVMPKTLLAPADEAPVLYIALYSFAQSDGCVLAVSLHHQAGDGSAQFSFVKAWCDEVKGIKSSNLSVRVHDRCCMPQAPSPPNPIPPAYRYIVARGQSPASHSAGNTILVRFPAVTLRELKSRVSAAIPPPHFISSNDLLLALLFRATTRAKELSLETHTFMKVFIVFLTSFKRFKTDQILNNSRKMLLL